MSDFHNTFTAPYDRRCDNCRQFIKAGQTVYIMANDGRYCRICAGRKPRRKKGKKGRR